MSLLKRQAYKTCSLNLYTLRIKICYTIYIGAYWAS